MLQEAPLGLALGAEAEVLVGRAGFGEKFVAVGGGSCSGTCAVYELYVFDDGRVIFLGKKYTVWGQVIEGMDNVDKIKRGEPVQNPDKIKSLKVAADAK